MNDASTTMTLTSERDVFTGRVQLFLVAVVLSVAFAISFLMQTTANEVVISPGETYAPPVEVLMPARISETLVVEATGIVRTPSNVVISPQVSGRVVEISSDFAAGGSFRKSETLFVIEQTDFDLAVKQATADLQSAMSALNLEQAEAETAVREWKLISGDEPIPSLVAREPQIAQAEASVAAARSRLESARVDLERTHYSLPFDGRVLNTSVQVGQTLTANQAYGEVYEQNKLELFVSVDARQLSVLTPVLNRTAIVELVGMPGDTRLASVVRVEAQLDPQTRQAGLILSFEDPSGILPGTFAHLEIQGRRLGDLYRLPASSLSSTNHLWIVDNGVLSQQQVEVLSFVKDAYLVKAFDVADGVVTTIPAGARQDLIVSVQPRQDVEGGRR